MPEYVRKALGLGMAQLIVGDYVRPAVSWLLTTASPLRIASEMAHVRDPAGFAELAAVRAANSLGDATMLPAIEKIALVMAFWKDLERHHPAIDTLRLSHEIAAAWKQRARTRTIRSTGPDGEVVEITVERDTAADVLMTVRSFYLDLAQWAFDDPGRWGRWAVPCPIRADDTQYRKMTSRRKARMDQRTRERLPVLPTVRIPYWVRNAWTVLRKAMPGLPEVGGLPPRLSRRTRASTTVTSGQDIGPPSTLNEPATANGVPPIAGTCPQRHAPNASRSVPSCLSRCRPAPDSR
ncbi:hypothetical protein [Nocardia sp. Marseille-Q1738]